MTRDLIYNITKRNLTGGQAPCESVYIVLTTDNRYNKKLAVK